MSTTLAVPPANRGANRSGRIGPPGGQNKAAWLLLTPVVIFLAVAFLVPIGYVAWLSVTEPAVSLAHYKRILGSPLYLSVLLNTFKTAGVVTLVCLLLGYPLAYVMARSSGRTVGVLLAIVGVSFYIGFVVRTYAWLVILGRQGPLAQLMRSIGIDEPPQMIFTSFATTLGMTHILLPYMVLAMYGVMRKIDNSHLLAAASLGATPWNAFRWVFLPLSLPGLVTGCVLVFTIALGFYVTPILLGTPRDMMLSQLINEQMEQLLAWGFASALAMVLLVCTLGLLAIYDRYAGLDRLWG